jgi:hypothetical protein
MTAGPHRRQFSGRIAFIPHHRGVSHHRQVGYRDRCCGLRRLETHCDISAHLLWRRPVRARRHELSAIALIGPGIRRATAKLCRRSRPGRLALQRQLWRGGRASRARRLSAALATSRSAAWACHLRLAVPGRIIRGRGAAVAWIWIRRRDLILALAPGSPGARPPFCGARRRPMRRSDRHHLQGLQARQRCIGGSPPEGFRLAGGGRTSVSCASAGSDSQGGHAHVLLLRKSALRSGGRACGAPQRRWRREEQQENGIVGERINAN